MTSALGLLVCRAPRPTEEADAFDQMVGLRAGSVTAVLVRVRPCARADRDHMHSRRRYAHVGHAPGPVVCVATAFWRLPEGHQRGILLHELGHLALAGRSHTEADADRAARRRYGAQIRYRDSKWGRRLEYA